MVTDDKHAYKILYAMFTSQQITNLVTV